MIRWEQGRAVVDSMIAEGSIQRVPASREHADRLLEMSDQKLMSAELVLRSGDTASAVGIAYDAARLALTAVLANEGLRPRTEGGHRAVFEVAMAQLEPPLGQVIKPFDRMRRQRNDSQYPALDSSGVSADDVERDMDLVRSIVTAVRKILDAMPHY